MNHLVAVAILAMLPISELRGAITYGAIAGQPLLAVVLISIIFNMLVFPIVMIFLTFLHKGFCRMKYYKKHIDRFLERVHKKSHRFVEKYGYWGLALFVAVPLPVTGAYTGSFAAWLFGMEKKKAFLAIAIGVVIAAIIVTATVTVGVEIFEFLKGML